MSFEGFCSNPACGKWGHKASECWTPDPRKTQVGAVGDQAAKGDGQNGSPAATPQSTITRQGCSAVRTSAVCTTEEYYIGGECAESYYIGECGDEGYPLSWVMAARASGQVGMIGQVAKAQKIIALKDDAFLVLWDSGSDEHLTQSDIAEETGQPTYCDGPPLEDVQGNAIEDLGSS